MRLSPLVSPALMFGLSFGANLIVLAHPAFAEKLTRATAPVYGQVVVFAMPPGFSPGHEAEENGAYILELVPDRQTVQNWSEMVTLTGVQDMVSLQGLPPPGLVDWALNEIAAGYQDACATQIIYEVFNDAPPKGVADGVLAYVGCANSAVTGQSEQMMFWITVAGGNLYTLQRAERGPAQDSIAFDPPAWFARYDLLSHLALCVPQAGEQAPYPSCLD